MSSAEHTESAPATEPKKHWLVQYFLDFKVLADNPPAFWAVQAINLLDSVAYFALLGVVTLFLSQTIALDKVSTGYVVTAFTTFVTVSLFVAGFVTDSLGIKKSLFIAQALALGSRFTIAACGLMPDLPGRAWIVAGALIVSAPGAAMTQTVFQAANKRFSTVKSRSASFNIWYLIMNIGAMVGGYSIDLVRLTFQANLSWIFVVAAVSAAINVLTTIVAISNVTAQAGDEEAKKSEPAAPKKSPLDMLKGVVSESAFWRFIVLMVAVLGVRAVFAYMYLLMPQYWVEVIEKTGSAKTDQGLLQAINPILIVIGLILFIPIANRFNVFKMLVSGAFISALSLGIMALPWNWFGPTMAEGYFAMSVVMLTVLSIGELVWSPKLTEYTAAIAPQGQEGTYLGLSMVPWFGAKLLVSAMSGHMLERWVPEESGLARMCGGEAPFWSTPEAMWTVLFIWAVLGPAVALVFKGWLTQGASGLEPAVKSTAASARNFRIYAAVGGVVVVAAIGGFLWFNASRPAPTFTGVDGKPLPGQVRSERDAQTCGCWAADKEALGARLCTQAKPADMKDDKEVAAFRKDCLERWFAAPATRCTELCATARPSGTPDAGAIAKHVTECQAKCAGLASAPALDSKNAGFCAERVVALE